MKKTFSGIMMMLLLTSMLMLAFNIRQTESSEPPRTEWTRTYGGPDDDVARCVVATDDGGYAVLGYTYSFGAGQADVLLIKTNGNGDVQWNRTYGDVDWERGYCLIQTNDGGYAIAGEKAPSPPPSDRDFWLIKTDANGIMQWNRTYGGTREEEAYSVIQADDGGYAIAGRTLSFGVVGLENFWVVKTDSDGNMEWNKAYGGTGIEIAYSILQTSDGGYAIGGETGAHGNVRDVWLVKTDSDGTMQWNKTYRVGTVDYSTSLVQTKDGGYALAGSTETPAGGFADVILVKTYANGTMQWNKTYGGTLGDWAWSLVHTMDGGYALVGGTESYGSGCRDFWFIRTDSAGNAQWNETYGGAGTDWAYSVIQTNDGGYAVTGSTESSGAGGQDFWLIKLVPLISWEYVFEDPCRGTVLKISTDDQYFQFIAPDKIFAVKHDADMCVFEYRWLTSLAICYVDDDIKLSTCVFDGRFDFCFAYAKDVQTGNMYLLIDKRGIESENTLIRCTRT